MTTTGWIVAILSFAVALVLGFAACTLIRRRKEKNDQRKIEDAEQEALRQREHERLARRAAHRAAQGEDNNEEEDEA